jgi:integrase
LIEVLPAYLKPFVAFAYRTGWRRSEIENLTWAQVDLTEGIVRLEPGTTKNDQARTVYLDEELKSILNALWGARKYQKADLPWVFLRKNSQIGDFRFSWEKACEKIKMPGLLFHDCRRSAVRNMVRAGIPERVAMMISGHKTRSIFDRYNIVSDADLKRAAKQQESYLSERILHNFCTIQKIGTKKGTTRNG